MDFQLYCNVMKVVGVSWEIIQLGRHDVVGNFSLLKRFLNLYFVVIKWHTKFLNFHCAGLPCTSSNKCTHRQSSPSARRTQGLATASFLWHQQPEEWWDWLAIILSPQVIRFDFFFTKVLYLTVFYSRILICWSVLGF